MKKAVLDYIKSTYGVTPEYLWESTPNNAAIRNPKTKKWFGALICDLPKAKFGLPSDEKVDLINLKCDPMLAFSVVDRKGIFPAYHMNKEHWISVFLDGSVELEQIIFLINLSYDAVDKK